MSATDHTLTDAFRDPETGRIYLNGRRFADLPYVMDPTPKAIPLRLMSADDLAARLTDAEFEDHVCCVKRDLCRDKHFHQRDVESILAARLATAEAEKEALRAEVAYETEQHAGWVRFAEHETARAEAAEAAEAALAGLVAAVEALAEDVEHSRQHAEMDPTILRRDGEWADLQPVLRALLDADHAAALRAREAKVAERIAQAIETDLRGRVARLAEIGEDMPMDRTLEAERAASTARAEVERAWKAADELTRQLTKRADALRASERRLAGLVAKIEALADRWHDYGRTAPTDVDQRRWWSVEASLRALIPADAATDEVSS